MKRKAVAMMGKFKLFMIRSREYVSWFQLGIIVYGAIVFTDLNLVHVGVMSLIGLAFMLFDWFVIFPSQLNQSAFKNPFLVRMEENQREIIRLIGGLK